LFARKLLLITGKGGIGKSLISAAIGQAAAERGARVLIVENAAVDQIAPIFGCPTIGHQTTRVYPGLECINLNAEENFRDYVVKHLGQKRLFESVLSHRVVQSFISVIPGLGELMFLGRLFYECELAPEPRYDLVIFDAPASGHFMSLMTTPDAVLDSNLGGPLRRETERVKAFLSDRSKAGILYIATPEELVVSEALDFLPRLAKAAPAELMAVLVNRMPTWNPASLEQGPHGAAQAFLLHQQNTATHALKTLKDGLTVSADLRSLPVLIIPEDTDLVEPLKQGEGRRLMGDTLTLVLGKEAP
jgi:anion-transporting  ArsA/GET3 family ATPase